jgi:hypothetical protein
MIGALVGLLVAGVVAVFALLMVMLVFGLVLGAVGLMIALAVKVVPFLLLGWIGVKLVQRAERPRAGISAADQHWLDSAA